MTRAIRNIAIIAHVDHGKTTLVDKMLLAGSLFKEHEKVGELIMDNNDIDPFVEMKSRNVYEFAKTRLEKIKNFAQHAV